MYSFSYLEPVCCSMSSSNCCFLTCIQISQEAGQVARCSHLCKNFPQFVVIHAVKSFGIVNKAEVDVFLELFCLFNEPVDAGNLISGSSAFSKSSTNIWKFSSHKLLKPSFENFKHYFGSVWDECNCVVVWAFFESQWTPGVGDGQGGLACCDSWGRKVRHDWATDLIWSWAFFGIAFLWDWNKNWPFSVLWPLLSFLNLLAYWVQHFHSIIFYDLK